LDSGGGAPEQRWRRIRAQARNLATVAGLQAAPPGPAIAPGDGVTKPKIIAVRHLRAGGRSIAVHFFRNQGGSVAGRAFLSEQDTPIVDGPDPDAVLEVLRDVIDSLLLARKTA
jgi:hypothetical protein